tara:strand:- start:43343 stop:43978 length:636 start_codon:yes stop_codon:yes gene_type:complete
MTVSFVLTYDSLIETVEQYLERQDEAVVNQIPTFITLCEFEIAQQIKTLGQMQVVQTNFVAGNPVLAKPARWRKTVSMSYTDALGEKQPILLRKYEYLKAYWPNATSTSAPKYYADYDYEHWLIAPTPATALAVEILFYERIAPLSSTNQTNWLTQNAPNVMLFGTLLQAMPFLKNDTRQIFQEKYSQALSALKLEDDLRLADRQAIAKES